MMLDEDRDGKVTEADMTSACHWIPQYGHMFAEGMLHSLGNLDTDKDKVLEPEEYEAFAANVPAEHRAEFEYFMEMMDLNKDKSISFAEVEAIGKGLEHIGKDPEGFANMFFHAAGDDKTLTMDELVSSAADAGCPV